MKEILQKGLDITKQKKVSSQKMNLIAKSTAKAVGLRKEQLIALKDYQHYYGRGWGVDAISKSDKSVKFPDRVSPTFRKLVEIVTNLRDADMLDFLAPYLEACEKHGVKITIEINKVERSNKAKLQSVIDKLDDIQSIICDCNNKIVDTLAPQAVKEGFAPKGKFKDLVERAYALTNGNKVHQIAKIDEQIKTNKHYTTALDEVKSI